MDKQNLSLIYKRAMQYCVSAYGTEPDELQICIDGNLQAKWLAYNRYDDDTYEEFTVDNLSEDLDKVYEERKKRDAEKAEIARLAGIEREKEFKKAEKEKRKNEYLKLKKEFE